jgi:tRNA pseudouridine55 synthase
MDAFNGILLIDKPAGITSARVVPMVKRLLPRGTKVGHAGTLDPFATGLLVILIGKATRMCESVMGQPKTYEGTIKLGATTETDDVDSPENPTGAACAFASETIENTLSLFRGSIQQAPPKYSALKIAGKRACDRVRAGETVELARRTVTIYDMKLIEYAAPLLKIRVDCGRGTYIRALARDIGEKLGAGGYLKELRRTRIGEFDVATAIRPDELTVETIPDRLLPSESRSETTVARVPRT